MSIYRLLMSFAFVVACGGTSDSDVDLENHDPRCVTACPETTQEIQGVGEVCNAASRTQCLDECEARIAGLAKTCQTCLLEDACFDPECEDDSDPIVCNNGVGTVTGWNGSCTFDCSDDAARIACFQQVMPTREVACTVTWRSTVDCAALCN